MAIDERRAFFRTNLWRDPPKHGPRDLKQVWFPGVHCDVGGGYPESESGLARTALKWMLDEAVAAGLAVRPDRVQTVLGHDGPPSAAPPPAMHQSLCGLWWLAELVFKRHYDWGRKAWGRRMNLGRRRTMPAGALVHRSALLLGPDYQKYLPADHRIVE